MSQMDDVDKAIIKAIFDRNAPFTSFIKVEDIQFNLPHNFKITMDELQDRLELMQKGTEYIELARGAGQIHSARLTAEGRQYERKRRA